MPTMENWKMLAVIVALGTLACSAHGMSFTLDKERWISKNWEDPPLVETLASELSSLFKRSKAQQFYGLMGKRADLPQPMRLGPKRKKGEMFVGLMGRRALSEDAFQRLLPTEISTVVESDKQSDLREEWDSLHYY